MINYNENFINKSESDLLNRGFLYGDGFFETIKIFNKKPFNLENHFDRIIYSADLLDIKFTLSVLDLNKSILILIEKNNKTWRQL